MKTWEEMARGRIASCEGLTDEQISAQWEENKAKLPKQTEPDWATRAQEVFKRQREENEKSIDSEA